MAKFKIKRSLLKNYEKPYGYKTYNHYCTDKGCYTLWSRDGKRFYLSGGINAKLFLLPDTPFKSITEARDYLDRRLKKKSNFP